MSLMRLCGVLKRFTENRFCFSRQVLIFAVAMGKGKLAYHILAFIVVAVWGVTFISTKVLIGAGLLPSQIFAMRFIVAYAGIWILCIMRGEGRGLWSRSVADELMFVFLGITGGSFYFLAENTALACTQACTVAFIVCSAPLMTALLTLLFRRLSKGRFASGMENVRVGLPLILGTVLSLGGMACVLFDGNSVEFSLKGDFLALAAALCWAFYSLFMGQMTREYGSLFATRKVFFYGLLTIIPFVAGQELDMRLLARPEVLGNLAFLSVAASLACFVAWNKVMSRLGNVTATNYVYLNPFFTLVSAVLLLGESLTLQSALGCFAIVTGVAVAGYSGDKS